MFFDSPSFVAAAAICAHEPERALYRKKQANRTHVAWILCVWKLPGKYPDSNRNPESAQIRHGRA
jgi:hypothetical protein